MNGRILILILALCSTPLVHAMQAEKQKSKVAQQQVELYAKRQAYTRTQSQNVVDPVSVEQRIDSLNTVLHSKNKNSRIGVIGFLKKIGHTRLNEYLVSLQGQQDRYHELLDLVSQVMAAEPLASAIQHHNLTANNLVTGICHLRLATYDQFRDQGDITRDTKNPSADVRLLDIDNIQSIPGFNPNAYIILDLSGQTIINFEPLRALQHVVQIRLNNCQLTELPAELHLFEKTLEVLELNGNRIHLTSKDLGGFTRLEYLKLRDNNLDETTFPVDSLNKLLWLKQVHLQDNQFKDFAIEKLTNTKLNIKLGRNPIPGNTLERLKNSASENAKVIYKSLVKVTDSDEENE